MVRGFRVDDMELKRNMIYFIFAEKFGWLPEQVDKLGQTIILDMLKFIEEKAKYEEEQMKKNSSRV